MLKGAAYQPRRNSMFAKLICWLNGHDVQSFEQHVIRHSAKKPGRRKSRRRKSYYTFTCERCKTQARFTKQQQYEYLYGRNGVKFEADFPWKFVIGQAVGAVFIGAVVIAMFLIL